MSTLSDSQAWDEFLEFVGRLSQWEGFEANERDYKLEIADNASQARQAFLDGDDDWMSLLDEAFGPPNNLASWRLQDALSAWFDDDPEQLRVGFRILWAEDGTAAERVGGFLEVLPDELVEGTSRRLSLASFLLMGVDATTYPYYDVAPFRDAYRLVGYDEPDYRDPVDAYDHALEFLDRLIEDADQRDIEIRDRQDAQSLVWMLTGKDPASLQFLDEDLRERLAGFLEENIPEEDDEQEGEGMDEASAAQPVEIEQLVDELFVPVSQCREMLEVLERRKNLVLEGPAGVGKTYLARRLAFGMLGERDDQRVGMVQFHPAYGYEEFVQGYRPLADGGAERRNGVFVEFCRRARTDTARAHVFVIEEIGRGNLREIFGELTTLLEAERRGPEHAIPLQHAASEGETFCVPKNVHVIGTRRATAGFPSTDEGVLRRRFAVAELEPAFGRERFQEYLVERDVPEEIVERISERMTALNETIACEIGAEYRIGHGYFCPSEDAPGPYDESWYRQVVEYEIRPVLRHYWFDRPERVDREIEALLADY